MYSQDCFEKLSEKKPKHAYTFVNIIHPLPLPIKNKISNTHKNQIPQVNILQLIYQHLLIQTNMLFLMKLVINMTVQHHISRIQLFFKMVN